MSLEGTVVAAHGRHYEVVTADGRHWQAVPRGKKSLCACGDRVVIEATGDDGALITDHLPRRTLLYRSDAWKQKLIAANADQIVLVTATEPAFSAELLSRALVAAEHEGIRAVIVLNKCDLTAALAAAREQLRPFAALGYPMLELSAHRDASALRPWLAGRTTVLVGQSGMGKSTLINALIPGARAATREISSALDSGKHTTTHTRLYRLDDDTTLIDSPGMQEFGLAHLTRAEIEQGFREFHSHLDRCRFRDCRHDREPDCALRAAVTAGRISPRRLEQFHALCASCGK